MGEPVAASRPGRAHGRKLRHTFRASVCEDWLVEGSRHDIVRLRTRATMRSKGSKVSGSRSTDALAERVVQEAFVVDDVEGSPTVFAWMREDLVGSGRVRRREFVRAVAALIRQKGELPRLRRPRTASVSGAGSPASLSTSPQR